MDSGDKAPATEGSDEDAWGEWTKHGIRNDPKTDTGRSDRTLVIQNVLGMYEKDLLSAIRQALGQADTTAKIGFAPSSRTAFVTFESPGECGKVLHSLNGKKT